MADDNKIQYLGPTSWSWIAMFVYTELLKYQKAVEGKGLSEQDFTTTLKNKLDAIDMSKYSTTEQMTAAINAAIADKAGVKFEKIDSGGLPTTGTDGIIYLIPNGTDTSGTDIYTEYYWDSSREKYEILGSTVMDLSNYLQKTDIREMTKEEIFSIWQRYFTDATLPTS